MTEITKIAMFPLSIFPLPGELVPLHIFEPRYRQLLHDAETKDIPFGIYFTHTANDQKLGSLVKLESVIKRYSGGESDIIVKCIDLFELKKLLKTYRDKLYPGGEVNLWNLDLSLPIENDRLLTLFKEYRNQLKITPQVKPLSVYDVANELNLDNEDKLKFASANSNKKEAFLISQLRYHTQLLNHVELSKDVFHLN
jgi:Uncharacterized protein, similar to the N-terminal domain of Lon protease